jgi:hypothetical protein
MERSLLSNLLALYRGEPRPLLRRCAPTRGCPQICGYRFPRLRRFNNRRRARKREPCIALSSATFSASCCRSWAWAAWAASAMPVAWLMPLVGTKLISQPFRERSYHGSIRIWPGAEHKAISPNFEVFGHNRHRVVTSSAFRLGGGDVGCLGRLLRRQRSGSRQDHPLLVPLRRLPKVFPRRPQQLVLGGALFR